MNGTHKYVSCVALPLYPVRLVVSTLSTATMSSNKFMAPNTNPYHALLVVTDIQEECIIYTQSKILTLINKLLSKIRMPPILTIFDDLVNVLRYSTVVPVCFLDHMVGFLNIAPPVHECTHQLPYHTSPVELLLYTASSLSSFL